MKISRNLSIVLLIIANIAADQISKFLVRLNVEVYSITQLVGDYFILTNVENSGAFLGLGSDFNPILKFLLLLVLPISVLGYVIYYIVKTKELDRLSFIAFCTIVGGGIGNVYDRIVYGSVTDFFHIDFGGPLKTGIFNIADLSVTTGMILLLIANFKPTKKD